MGWFDDNHPMGATAMAELDYKQPPKKRGVAKPKKVAAKQPAKVAKKVSPKKSETLS